jgi:isocitrate lyase
MKDKQEQIDKLFNDWSTNSRWDGVKRGYSPEEVVKLRGNLKIE